MVQTDDDFYTIEYTGTPFNNMRYKLDADEGQVKLRILYWNAGSFQISVDNRLKNPTPWDKDLGTHAELTGELGCGENRYVGGADNFLEFILTPQCTVTVSPVNSFSSNVRMAWTLDEFYSTGGPTTFSDNVAGVLGIHSSQIKVVAVYEGSVVVDFTVEDVDDEEEEEEEVATGGFQASTVDVDADLDEAIDVTDGEEVVLLTAEEKLAISMEKLKVMIDENDAAFGAPVLSASVNEPGKETEDVKIDPSWTPPFSRLRRFTQKPKEEIPCIEEDYVCVYTDCEVVEDRYDGSVCTK